MIGNLAAQLAAVVGLVALAARLFAYASERADDVPVAEPRHVGFRVVPAPPYDWNEDHDG